jgi:hypothetical protein
MSNNSTTQKCPCSECPNPACRCGNSAAVAGSCCCGEVCTCGDDCACGPECGCPATQRKS